MLLCRSFGNKYGLTSTIGAFFIFVNYYMVNFKMGIFPTRARPMGISMLKEKDNQLSIYSILYNKIPIVVLADDKLRMGNDASK